MDTGTVPEKKFESTKVGSSKNFLRIKLLNIKFDLHRFFINTAHPRCFPTTLLCALSKIPLSNLPTALLQYNTIPTIGKASAILPANPQNIA
jgi:hypothetical protein